MAIDTREKRASVVGVASVWSPPAVQPSGAIDTVQDRQIIAWSYSGIAPPSPPPAPTGHLNPFPLLYRRWFLAAGRR